MLQQKIIRTGSAELISDDVKSELQMLQTENPTIATDNSNVQYWREVGNVRDDGDTHLDQNEKKLLKKRRS